MAALIVWMNKNEAKLFTVDANSIDADKVQYHGNHHPHETLGKNHPQNQTDEVRFFAQLIEKIRSKKFDLMLIMGPSLGGVHFATYLEKSAPDVLKKLIGVERVDQMPDSEILSIGRKYLQRHYLYNPA